uniref:Solute carrier family 25 member 45 n=1 Tax=Neogobius melanostomus TaxID=47308 RepID=A0A8C6UCW0_9GOBI
MPLEEFLAGSISGALGIAVGHPIDTVKVRLQALARYNGVVHCVTQTYCKEGVHGFFRGAAFPVLTTGLVNSLVFGAYSNALDVLSQSKRAERGAHTVPMTQVYAAGAFSGFIQVLVAAPIDLIKVRLQGCTSRGGSQGPLHCAMRILREEGPVGLYRGSVAMALRDIPCYGFYFLPYEVIRKALTEEGKRPGTFAVLMAGGVAGVVTWALATPMDVIKARLQLSGAGGRRYGGVVDCLRVSVREEGPRVLFRGLMLNSVRAFPVNAVTFLSYEHLMSRLCPPSLLQSKGEDSTVS